MSFNIYFHVLLLQLGKHKQQKYKYRYLNLLIDFYTHCFLKTMIAVNTSFEIKKKKKKKGRNRKLIINQRTILLQQSQNERNFPRNFIMSAYIN